MHLNSWENANCILYTFCYLSTLKYLTKKDMEMREKQHNKLCCKDRSYTVYTYGIEKNPESHNIRKHKLPLSSIRVRVTNGFRHVGKVKTTLAFKVS